MLKNNNYGFIYNVTWRRVSTWMRWLFSSHCCCCREFTWTSRWGSTPTTTPRSPPKTSWPSCSFECDSCWTRWSRSRRSRTTRGWSSDLWPAPPPLPNPPSPCVCVSASIVRSVFGWPARAPTSECCGGPSHRRSFSLSQESGRWNISRASSRPRNWCNLAVSSPIGGELCSRLFQNVMIVENVALRAFCAFKLVAFTDTNNVVLQGDDLATWRQWDRRSTVSLPSCLKEAAHHVCGKTLLFI